MTKRMIMLIAAGALIVLGVIVILLQPGAPATECAEPGGPTSGFVDGAKDCGISIESWNEISDYAAAPKPFRIAGIVIILVGLGTGVAAAFVRKPEPED